MKTNEQRLAHLWASAGMSIDEQRLRIFRLMSGSQQELVIHEITKETTVSLASTPTNQTNKTKGEKHDKAGE